MSTTKAMSNEPPAGNYDADELGQYRSLSSLAVIAFLLGLASVLMFATPVLIVVPLAAAAIAFLALRSIAASEGGLTGSKLAIGGLALAIFFAVGAYARVEVRDSILQGQVDQTCRQWLDLASRGEVEGMLEMMTQSASEKLQPKIEVGDPGSFFGGMLNSALMRQSPIVAELTKLRGEGSELQFLVREADVYAAAKPVLAGISYTISDGSSEEQSCSIGLKRLRGAGGKQVWIVDSWSLD